MILHISQDDKFLDTIVKIFESANKDQNNYVVWHQPNVKIPTILHHYFIKDNQFKSYFLKQKHIISRPSLYSTNITKNIKVNSFGSEQFFEQIGDLSKYTIVIFHSLVYNHAKLAVLIKAKYNIPVIWAPFGYEVYNMLPEFRKAILLPETKKFVSITKSGSDTLFDLITPFKARIIMRAINKIKYCAIAIDTEFELYKKILNPKLKQLWFSYYPLDYLINETVIPEEKSSILIGNSAVPSNNHYEIFQLLSKLDLGVRKLITPLSYGDHDYGLKINELGYELFGDNFHPLLDFLSLDDYNKTVNSCGVVIMNQVRQQAFGNILSALWFGAKVFLRPQNTIYQYLKNLGIFVYSIDDISNENSNIIQNLDVEKASSNKEILRNYYSLNHIVTSTKKIIENLDFKKNN